MGFRDQSRETQGFRKHLVQVNSEKQNQINDNQEKNRDYKSLLSQKKPSIDF